MAKNEAEIALQKVEEAEKEVSELKAQKAAKRAARCAKRLTWKGPFKLVGRLFNQYDEHPVEMWTGTLLGGAAGAAAVIGVKKGIEHFSSKTEDEEISDEASNEVVETPFDE